MNRLDDVSDERNAVEPELITIPSKPVINQPVEPNVGIYLRRSKRIRKSALCLNYVLYESDFNSGQANDLMHLVKKYLVWILIIG